MGLFTGRNTRNANPKHSRIDPATGRNKRDDSPRRETRVNPPPRQIGTGKVVDRAAWRRSQKTGRPIQRRNWGW